MSVYCVMGLPGSGKTYRMAELGVAAYRSGAEVYANFQLGRWVDVVRGEGPLHPEGCSAFVTCTAPNDHPWRKGMGGAPRPTHRRFVPYEKVHYLREWDDLTGIRAQRDPYTRKPLRRVVVLIDEMNLWAPSRFWQTLDIAQLQMWALSRKAGWEMWYSTQDIARVDTALREVTEYVYRCRRIGTEARPLFFFRRRWLPHELEKAKKPSMGMEISWFRKSTAEAFDTYEDVRPARAVREASERKGKPKPTKRAAT